MINLKKCVKGMVFGAAAAAAVLGSYAAARLMVKVAFDRKLPEVTKFASGRVSGGGKNPEFETVRDNAAEALENTVHETVQIFAHDGVKLAGRLFPCENAERIIIAFHGWRSSWNRDFGMISDFWHKAHCSVLYVEQRGQNGSGGEYMGFGLTERLDCRDWVKWTAQRFGNDIPLYLAGVSMGAATVLMASNLDFCRKINGIIADCGFTSPKAICSYVSNNNLHIPYKLHGAAIDSVSKRKIHMKLGDFSAPEALSETNIPVLFIHGTDDKFVPVEMSYENYKACASEKRLVIVPGADHTMSFYVEPEVCKKAILDFWKDFD